MCDLVITINDHMVCLPTPRGEQVKSFFLLGIIHVNSWIRGQLQALFVHTMSILIGVNHLIIFETNQFLLSRSP